jgi:hypothetical protein
LENANGTCGAWAELFIQTLRIHGITTAKKMRIVPTDFHHATYGDLVGDKVMVRDWNLDSGVLVPGTRIPAQGNNESPEAFNDHAVAQIGSTVYDASYGVTRSSQSAYEDAAFFGFVFRPASDPVNGEQIVFNNQTGGLQTTWTEVSFP